MTKPLDVKGKTISQVIRWYYDNKLYVNRKYQRKLVWTLDEKKLFIDSLLNKYPTPSIILNEVNTNGNIYYEIIDGMQRLDAIISFLQCDFTVSFNDITGYFNTSAIAALQQNLPDKEKVSDQPLLLLDDCYEFSDIEIPVVICNQTDDTISEIFCRINSSGKKLSLHDLRQASIVDNFSELVRRCAIYIRGDYTYTDSVNLCDMRKISLSGTGLHYGIDSNGIFWRRHQIITFDNLRQSRDEEIIASILINILTSSYGRVNRNLLDKVYSPQTKENSLVNNKIELLGMTSIEEAFNNTKSIFDSIFLSVNSTFSNYLFSAKTVSGKDNIFQTVFLTLYQLSLEGYIIQDYPKVAKLLKTNVENIFEKYISGKNVSSSDADNMYILLYPLLKNDMIKSITRNVTPLELEIRRRLSLSSIESSMSEYKIGLLDFNTHNFNVPCLEKIAKTLVAMANSPANDIGYVIVGIADNTSAYNDWKADYNKNAFVFSTHYVVGITSEALQRYPNLDAYLQAIKDHLKSLPISEPLKQFVLTNMQIINFEDRDLLIFESQKTSSISKYDNVVYVRNGNSTEIKPT